MAADRGPVSPWAVPASADFAPVSPSAPLPAFAERFGRVDKKVRAALENLGLRAVGDLLAHYPRRHEDRTRFDRFPNQPTGQPLCLRPGFLVGFAQAPVKKGK